MTEKIHGSNARFVCIDGVMYAGSKNQWKSPDGNTLWHQALQTAGAGLNDKNAPIGMLLHDEDAADNLQRTLKNLRVSSQELSEDLKALQHNFLLRGFFKKKDKQ